LRPLTDKNLRLVEVVKGAECKVPNAKIVDALGPLAKNVEIRKACAAYDKFEMVEDRNASVAEAPNFVGPIVKSALAVIGIGALTALIFPCKRTP
jgi:hypothetical protein